MLELLELLPLTICKKTFQILNLNKKGILTFSSENGINVGPQYKTIYQDFVLQTTKDISTLVKKWKKSGAIDKLLELENN